MKLVLEIEFLTGVCRAANSPDNDFPDWPPQPDRIFSALTSAWGARGESSEERSALKWLEEQPVPELWASPHNARTAPAVFVPPNDQRASTTMKNYLRVLPDRRPRQPRRFPVARPNESILEIVWPDAPNQGIFNALNAIASCVGYIGHSASLARCRFLVGEVRKLGREPFTPLRRVYAGRLNELERAHRAKPHRPEIRPGNPVFVKSALPSESSSQWLVLEAARGDIPDIRASSLVCRLLRQTLMAGYRKIGRQKNVPETVSGHAADGAPTRNPHLAIVPMAFVGSTHADGRVLGLGVIPPRGESLLNIDGFRMAFESVAPYSAEDQRRVLTLEGPPLRSPLRLAPTADDGGGRRSLLPRLYVGCCRRWASVTPIVLERHLKRRDDSEVRELVALACTNAGLPEPDPSRIQVGKHASVSGAPPARPLAGEPSWMRWKVPSSLNSRQLVHAVIDFEQRIRGPVLLGAGRFTGLGLCRGLEDRK